MVEKCERLMTFNIIQAHILKRHIDEHKWFIHCADKNKAMTDFIQKYGFAMREIYCELCPFHQDCKVEKEVFHIEEEKE